MKQKAWMVTACILSLPHAATAAQSIYCPGNHDYIKVGMSEAQVLSACGQPTRSSGDDEEVTQRVEVKQLLYTTLNQGNDVYPTLNPLYTMWSLPSGSTGITLEIDIVNNKVRNVSLNGSSSNSTSVCSGGSISPGDDESKVYSVCGSPQLVNTTYVNMPIPNSQKPKVWTYKPDPYQPEFRLTFTNGQLQSID